MKWFGKGPASHFSKRFGLKDEKNTYDIAMAAAVNERVFVIEKRERGKEKCLYR